MAGTADDHPDMPDLVVAEVRRGIRPTEPQPDRPDRVRGVRHMESDQGAARQRREQLRRGNDVGTGEHHVERAGDASMDT